MDVVGESTKALASMTLSQEAWQRLIEAGFLASDAGFHSMATDLFANLMKLRPHVPQFAIFQSMALLRWGRIEQAETLLMGVRQRFPDSQMAKAVHGTCRMLLDNSDGIALLEEVIANPNEPDAVAWARLFAGHTRSKSAHVKAPVASVEGLQFFRHFNRAK